MKRISRGLLFVIITLFVNSISPVFGQYYYYNNKYYDKDLLFEVGLGAGGMNCITDIGGAKSNGGLYINDINYKNTRLNGSLYVSGTYQNLLAVTLQATFGSVEAYDSIFKSTSSSARSRYLNRNASFKSSISEIAVSVDFYPLMLKYYENGPPKISPYISLGLGWFSFNPRTMLNGRWVDLKPLRTEGQNFKEYKDRKSYHLSQANVPFGFGLKYELSPVFNIRAELIHRITFTDYLDDVSTTFIDPNLFETYLTPLRAAQARAIYARTPVTQANGSVRGDSKNKDSYMTLNLKVGIVLGREQR